MYPDDLESDPSGSPLQNKLISKVANLLFRELSRAIAVSSSLSN
ncbi:MAG: hypothetical protein V7K62_09280 [Nostoc sp.]